MHSDDGEAHRRRSFLVTSFSSVLTGGGAWESRLLLYVTDNAKSCSATFDGLDSWIAWSFTELASGQWFGHSPWGEPLDCRKDRSGSQIAGGFCGILVAHRGDEKAMAKAYHFKRNWLSANVCARCSASRLSDSPYLYTAFGKNAPHRSTAISLTSFVEDLCDSNAWVRVPGFHPTIIQYDWLHVVDIGLTPECAGSVTCMH